MPPITSLIGLVVLSAAICGVAWTVGGLKALPLVGRRRRVLKAHGLFIGFFGALMVCIEVGTYLFHLRAGPFGFLNENRDALMGFFEAHGLALCMAAAFLVTAAAPVEPTRQWSMIGLGVGGLLFTANTTMYDISFLAHDAIPAYFVSTGFHLAFAVLHGTMLKS